MCRELKLVQACLTDDLLSPKWKRLRSRHAMSGHCYVAAEALYWLLGGPKSGYTSCVLRLDTERTHWFLRRGDEILDPTAEQFSERVPYELGRGSGFLTKGPSRRARIVMERVKHEGQVRAG